jgi:hypothetical protein
VKNKVSNPKYELKDVGLIDPTTFAVSNSKESTQNTVVDELYKTKKPFEPSNSFKDEDAVIRANIVSNIPRARNGVEL